MLERAGITRDNSINQLDLGLVDGEHYGEKWLRMGSLNPSGFDYARRRRHRRSTANCLSASEKPWSAATGYRRAALDSAAPIICIQAGSKRTTRRGRADRVQ